MSLLSGDHLQHIKLDSKNGYMAASGLSFVEGSQAQQTA